MTPVIFLIIWVSVGAAIGVWWWVRDSMRLGYITALTLLALIPEIVIGMIAGPVLGAVALVSTLTTSKALTKPLYRFKE